MKYKLDNVVDDIYKKLSVLGKGKQLKISEDEIQNFGEAMKDSLRSWCKPHAHNKSPSLRMSNIGKKPRQLWFDMNSPKDKQEALPPSLFIKFLYGHLLEEVMLFLVKLSGHKVTGEQKEVSVDGIKGHMDCIIDGEVVDIKTTSGFSFSKFKDGTLAEQDTFGYMSQLAGYEEAEGTKDGGFLAINKETGELALFKPSTFDKPNIKEKIKKLKSYMKKKTPPEFCYTPVPDGVSGNMKLPRECEWCRHKFECHKDTNEGKGLRVFQYAGNKRKYLTQTPKLPRVPEIT